MTSEDVKTPTYVHVQASRRLGALASCRTCQQPLAGGEWTVVHLDCRLDEPNSPNVSRALDEVTAEEQQEAEET